jgi:hypothetical protein
MLGWFSPMATPFSGPGVPCNQKPGMHLPSRLPASFV